ncbi:hypothetical protein [Zooshikella sp. RANM57]|uniref:hypothetical protein n=1 Tax=Zooshikella sp. RANM57 TaxID=3425863 RepID=UPI003D6E0304
MKVVGTLVLTVCVPVLGWVVFEDYWYRQFIPKEIGLAYRLSIGSDSGFREGCGVAVFKLSDETYQQISHEGISFFKNIQQARGSSDYSHSYGDWSATPRKDWTRDEDIYWGFCGGNLSESLQSLIIHRGKQEGSFYAFSHEAWLMIIPQEKLVIYSHNG